mgnify:CR=1 FL=1
MKSSCFVVAAAFSASAAFGAVPEVSSVTMSQDSSRLVTITYTLANAPAVVTLDVLTNGVSIGGANIGCLSGDVNKIVTANGSHTITWRPDLSWPDHKISESVCQAAVTAWAMDCPPDYAVIDLVEKTDCRWRFYPAEEFLPGGILGNTAYRTSKLVMRKIHAKNVSWTMGSIANNTAHAVTLADDYYIGVFELTQGQFVTCVTNLANPSVNHVKVGDTWRTCPLENISVANFRIGGSGGNNVWPFYGREVGSSLKYRPLAMMRLCTGAMLDLPTEAQWEFACRAGTGSGYYNGTDSFPATGSRNNSNPSNNTTATWPNDKLPTARVEEGGTARVGSFAPNPWGLYDLYGNVWETCLDQFVTGLAFDQNTLETPFVEPEGSRTVTQMSQVYYVRRGGGWGANTKGGSAYRLGNLNSSPNSGIGYRLVCPVPYGKKW